MDLLVNFALGSCIISNALSQLYAPCEIYMIMMESWFELQKQFSLNSFLCVQIDNILSFALYVVYM